MKMQRMRNANRYHCKENQQRVQTVHLNGNGILLQLKAILFKAEPENTFDGDGQQFNKYLPYGFKVKRKELSLDV